MYRAFGYNSTFMKKSEAAWMALSGFALLTDRK